MKISLAFLKKRYYRFPVWLLIALAVGVPAAVYAARNSISFSTSGVSINNGATLAATAPVATKPITTCTSGSGTYTSNSQVLAWNATTAGTTAASWSCLQNTGTGNDVLSITGSPSVGTFNSPQNGQTLGAGQFVLVEFDWAIPSSATGTATFTVNVT